MANKNNHFVVAYYLNAAAADAAAQDLKKWDDNNKDVKLGAMGILHLDNGGHLKVEEIGQRDTGKGALWGTAIGATLGVLSAGILLVPGMAVGAAGGALLGALNHKSLGMTDADRDNMVEQLRHGGAALGVMCDDFEYEPTKAEMLRLGGKVEMYDVPEMTAAELSAAAAAQAEASDSLDAIDDAVDSAVTRTAEIVDDTADAVKSGASAVAATGAAAAAGLAAAVGLDSVDSDKLSAAGVGKASSLLKTASTAQGRAALAAETGVDEAVIYASVKKVDLMRVKGVGHVYASLLLASGVDSVPELSMRNPGNLVAKMTEVNAAQGITDNVPSESEVTDWVAQAKTMKKIVS